MNMILDHGAAVIQMDKVQREGIGLTLIPRLIKNSGEDYLMTMLSPFTVKGLDHNFTMFQPKLFRIAQTPPFPLFYLK